MAVDLMPHQEAVIDKISSGKILYGGVGSGKSITALYYYANIDTFGDLYVITTAKKRDSLEWEGDAQKVGVFPELEGYENHEKMVIDSWNNIAKYENVKGCTFIFDEQRLVGKGAWVKSFYKIAKNNAWIILSATPGDTWSDYIPVFVANGFFKNATEFSRDHIVWSPWTKFPKVERYLGIKKLERLKAEVLVEMPFKRDTKRDLQYVDVEYDRELFKVASVDRWNPYTDAPIMNVAELFSVMRRIVYSHPSRLREIRKLVEQRERLVIFYQFNFELQILRRLNEDWALDVPIGEWNGHRKQQIPDADQWAYLVQYTSGSEGWNCTETDSMAFYSLTYSYKKFEQSQGRIDRPITSLYKYLSYFALISDNPVDRAVLSSLERKKTFNEKRWFKEQFGENDPLLADLTGPV